MHQTSDNKTINNIDNDDDDEHIQRIKELITLMMMLQMAILLIYAFHYHFMQQSKPIIKHCHSIRSTIDKTIDNKSTIDDESQSPSPSTKTDLSLTDTDSIWRVESLVKKKSLTN